jgi:hypothetical chaperone protein
MFCAIDFGTSNSSIGVPAADGTFALVELEPGLPTTPTAVFYFADASAGGDPASATPKTFGRAALAAYVDGVEGRLMRSMKSLLGSPLLDQTTEVGGGRGVKYRDVVAGYLHHLKQCAEAHTGQPIRRAMLGRPVFFVDDDPARDAAAQAALQAAAHQVGFDDVFFQYEPIAAAFDYERGVSTEQIVLVADIGGGTSDFSVVRVGPQRRDRLDRRSDILANHGVHVAGTDFDRRIELAAILPEFGFGALGPSRSGEPAREVPSAVYFDLATWHLINTVYSPQRVAELRAMRRFYAEPLHHDRLLTVLTQHLGHDLAARAEAAKIAVAQGAAAPVDLGLVERGLNVRVTGPAALLAIRAEVDAIVGAARDAVAQAGLHEAQIDALYFTGGSTGLQSLTETISAPFSGARVLRGDRFASVAAGLGLHAQRWFGPRQGGGGKGKPSARSR